ncbi:hypothetical protein [Streptomyces sp. NPDC101206]
MRRTRRRGPAAFLVRPDGYLGTRVAPATAPEAAAELDAHLARVYRP